MKKISVICILFSFLSINAFADTVTLGTPEKLAVPEAPKMNWRINKVDASSKTLQVEYRYLDSTGAPIQKPNSHETWRTWTAQDRAAQLAANCKLAGEPYVGCTGAGTGENLDAGSTDFTDIFGYVIQASDVGKTIGGRLRTLIWTEFKADILPTNTGTFDAN